MQVQVKEWGNPMHIINLYGAEMQINKELKEEDIIAWVKK